MASDTGVVTQGSPSPARFDDSPALGARNGVEVGAVSGVERRSVTRSGWRLSATFVTWALVGLSVFFVLSSLWFTVLAHNAIPQGDEWDSLSLYNTILQQGDVLVRLFEPHNEHRLFFPRLILFSDYLFFGGYGLFDKAVILLVQVLETALFFWLIRQTGAGATARRGLCALVVVLFSSLYQSENFQWAFQVQFVGIFACASLCCTLFALGLAADGDDRRSAGLIAAAYLLALVATFTMANGILVGLVLVAMAVVARARRAVVSLTIAVAAALILAFSVGYHLYGRHESAGSLWHHAARVLAFTAGYLGNFARFGIESQVAFGALGLIAMAGIAGLMLVRRDADPTRLALLGIAGFTVGSAFITALGRSDAGMENIASSRYSTGAATFWAAILITGWSLSRGAVGGIAARVAVCAAALFLLEAAAQSQIPLGFAMQDRVAKYGAMEDAMLLGLIDRPALDDTQEPVGSVVAMVPVLRRLHLSIFRGRDAGLIGHPLSEIEAMGLPPLVCFGQFDSAEARPALGPNGVAVSGISGLKLRFGRPGRVYIVDQARRIVGFARTSFEDQGWRGYALAQPGADLTAYAVSDAGRTCRLSSVSVAEPAPP